MMWVTQGETNPSVSTLPLGKSSRNERFAFQKVGYLTLGAGEHDLLKKRNNLGYVNNCP